MFVIVCLVTGGVLWEEGERGCREGIGGGKKRNRRLKQRKESNYGLFNPLNRGTRSAIKATRQVAMAEKKSNERRNSQSHWAEIKWNKRVHIINKQIPLGYIRCDYFIVTHCLIDHVCFWWLFTLTNGCIRCSKITRDIQTDRPTDRWTDGHDLLQRCVVASINSYSLT